MIRSLALAGLLVAPCSHAASPSQRPRTLQELIDLTMTEGQEATMRPDAAVQMGLPEIEHPVRRLRYKQSVCPDKREHTFIVLYEKDRAGNARPQFLTVTVGTGKKGNGVITMELFGFLLGLDGSVRAADRTYGNPPNLKGEKLKLNAKMRKQAQAELNFHTKLVFALGLVPAK